MGISVSIASEALISRQFRRRRQFMAGAGLLLAASFVTAAGYGAVAIAPGQVIAILFDSVGITLPWEFSETQRSVLMAIRLPRVFLAVVTGAALAVCGAALQGLFRNPLADPGLIGVSSGAALAAVAVIVLGPALGLSFIPQEYQLPVAAFCGGLAAVFFVNRLSTKNGHTDVATMLLAGVAMNAIAGAGIGAFIFASDDQQLRELNFWMLGGLGGITWERLLPVAVLAVPGVLVLTAFGRFLNAMLLGESETMYLGFEVERTKLFIILLSAVVTGAAVSATGIIGFVGLVVPHLIRLTVGPGHQTLIPASMLVGASLMLIADIFARTVVLPAELPVGILTACVGGPFFLWLLVRGRAATRWS